MEPDIVFDVDLMSGTNRVSRLADAGYNYQRASFKYQSNGNGTFTRLGNHVPAFGPDGLQWSPSWTNVLPYSCNLTGASLADPFAPWGTCTRTYVSNAFGDLPGTTLEASSGSAEHGCYRNCPLLAASNAYTIFCWAKNGAVGQRYLGLRSPTIGAGDKWIWAVFDLQDGTSNVAAGASSASGMVDFGGGVWLCYLTYTTKNSEEGGFAVALYENATPRTDQNAPTFSGLNKTVVVGGCGVIQGPFPPLDPIRTDATYPAPVARASETCTATISNLPASFAFRLQARTYFPHLAAQPEWVPLSYLKASQPATRITPFVSGSDVKLYAAINGAIQGHVPQVAKSTFPGTFGFAASVSQLLNFELSVDGSTADSGTINPGLDRIDLGATDTATPFRGALQVVPACGAVRPAASDLEQLSEIIVNPNLYSRWSVESNLQIYERWKSRTLGSISQTSGAISAVTGRNGRTVAMATASKKPNLNATGLGSGQPSIDFIAAGGPDELFGDRFTALYGSQLTVLAAVKLSSASGNAARIISGYNAVIGNDYGNIKSFSMQRVGTTNQVQVMRNSSAVGTITLGYDTWGLVMVEWNGTQGRLILNDGTPTSWVASAGDFEIDQWWFGYNLTGSIADAIVVKGLLSDADRARVFGDLAHDLGLASVLPAGHPYKSAPPLVPPVAPARWTIANGLAVYERWKSRTIGTVITSGTAVTAITGQNGRSLGQGSSALQPALNATGIGANQPSIDFTSSGGPDSMSYIVSGSAPLTTSMLTVLLAIRMNSASSSGARLLSGYKNGLSDDTNIKSFVIRRQGATGNVEVVRNSVNMGAVPLGYDSWGLLMVEWSGSQARLILNDGTPTSWVSSTGNFELQNWLMGYQLTGRIADAIVFPSLLSTDERNRAFGDLAHDLGLTSVLPSGHPYQTNAPTTNGVVVVPPSNPSTIDPNFFNASRARLAPLVATQVPAWAWPQFARTLYVSPSGVDTIDSGTEANPMTLSGALNRIRSDYPAGGTKIVVRAGTYVGPFNITASGSRNAWNAIVGYPGERPVLKGMGWGTLTLGAGANYWFLEGITVDATRTGSTMFDGTPIVTESEADSWYIAKGGHPTPIPNTTYSYSDNLGNALDLGDHAISPSHHLVIHDVIACNAPGAGFAYRRWDWVVGIDNLAFNCARGSGFGQSGHTFFYPQAYDGDGDSDSYRVRFQRIVSHSNRQLVPSVKDPFPDLVNAKDGNGFIMDYSQTYAYPHQSLVESCLAFGNDGSGFHTVNYDRAHFIGNTAYGNNRRASNTNGELWFGWSNYGKAYNNICVATKSGTRIIGNTFSTNIETAYNIAWNGGGAASVVGANDLNADPLLVSPSVTPASADFRLQAGSPAIGRVHASVRASQDILSYSKSTPDAGAFWKQP